MTTTAKGQEKGKVSSKLICEMQFYIVVDCDRGSLMVQLVKNLPPMQEMHVRSLGQEDPLEKEIATHSSILAGTIPWTEEPGGLQSRITAGHS